jgi:hypothetical protein
MSDIKPCEFWTEDANVYFRLTPKGRMVFYDTTEEWPGTPIFSAQIAEYRLERLAAAIRALPEPQEVPSD